MSDDSYIGIAFLDGGRWHGAVEDNKPSPDGLDCWGLTKLFLENEFVVEALPEYGGTAAAELINVARDIAAAQGNPTWVKIDRNEARRGDIVTMVGREKVNGQPRNLECHVGVMVDRKRMLHVEIAAASAIVRLDHSSVRHRLAGFYRHVSLT